MDREVPLILSFQKLYFSFDSVAKACKAVQFILEDLELLCDRGSISNETNVSFGEDIKLIGRYLRSVQEASTDGHAPFLFPPPEDRDLAMDIVPAIDKVLLKVDGMIRDASFHLCIPLFLPVHIVRNLVERIRSVEVHGHRDDTFLGLTNSQEEENLSGIDGNSIIDSEIVIGFEDEARELQDKLTRGPQRRQVISIVGMPGIGKTTLARRLYNDLSVVYHFHTRAWVSASQVFQMRNLLCRILRCILSRKDPIFRMSDEDMGQKLYKCLKGHRYLIVIDDVWDIKVWNELKIYFPEDKNFSRILMTSRIKKAVRVKENSFIHCLRARNEKESWDLFNCKLFGDSSCPEELVEIANRIVAKCNGLPLAIVVIAGILVREKNNEKYWRKVHENMGSIISSSSKEFMDTLELSYKHLPSELKSCFLYLGSLPEISDIFVTRLFQSWIAEGFIQETEGKRLEDVAEDYLMDLVNRSLVTVAKKRSDGGIKSCNMHDVLRELCLKKTNEKKFVLPKCECGLNAAPFSDYERFLMYQGHFPHFSHCQYFHTYKSHYVSEDAVFNRDTLAVYRYLNTLDLRHIILDHFPDRILNDLLHLRDLALHLRRLEALPSTLFKLWNLETCILDGERGGKVILPCAIFKMEKLRHLKVSGELHLKDPRKCSTGGRSAIRLQCFQTKLSQQHLITGMGIMEDRDRPSSSRNSLMEIAASLPWRQDGILENLQSLSQLCPAGFINRVLERTPNLRKLGLHMTFSKGNDNFSFPDLSHLNHLEALKFKYQTLGMVAWSFPHPHMFPPSLKKLTLIGSHVNWNELSILELLPSLEVLKIKDNFFNGPQWETSDHGFPCLKFLKLSHTDLREWISSSSHFPNLQKLVLNGCLELKEIPYEIGEIPTLQTIKVYRSSESTMESARQIHESNIDIGNYDLKVFIFHHFEDC
nr:putative late blight resistance protein homolog R1A-3 [Coffea arabica]